MPGTRSCSGSKSRGSKGIILIDPFVKQRSARRPSAFARYRKWYSKVILELFPVGPDDERNSNDHKKTDDQNISRESNHFCVFPEVSRAPEQRRPPYQSRTSRRGPVSTVQIDEKRIDGTETRRGSKGEREWIESSEQTSDTAAHSELGGRHACSERESKPEIDFRKRPHGSE